MQRSQGLFVLFSSFFLSCASFFFFNDTATTEIYTLSLHDALPICGSLVCPRSHFEFREKFPARSRRTLVVSSQASIATERKILPHPRGISPQIRTPEISSREKVDAFSDERDCFTRRKCGIGIVPMGRCMGPERDLG